MKISNIILRMKKDKQVNMGKTSFLKLNSINISHKDTKETTINEFKKCFFFAQKHVIQYQNNQWLFI